MMFLSNCKGFKVVMIELRKNRVLTVALLCANSLCAMQWDKSVWISASDAKVADKAVKERSLSASGTSWFVREFTNRREVQKVKWLTTALGVYELYLNGRRVGAEDVLKPGFTHARKTRQSFEYDVTEFFIREKGGKNIFAAEVSAGWWRDGVADYQGRKSAFRSEVEVFYVDGSREKFGTDTVDWKAGVGGPVVRAGIYDGEEYDARLSPLHGGGDCLRAPELNREFSGKIFPAEGGRIYRRYDKTLVPVASYIWSGVDGADAGKGIAGRVRKLREVRFDGDGVVRLAKGENLIVDFGQNAAAVPGFEFRAAAGTRLTCLPAEMLNDGMGEKSRGNDGPGGSIYRANFRLNNDAICLRYTFAGEKGFVAYMPRHTFFGFRYIGVCADGDLEIRRIVSVPVSSVAKAMEIGKIETGDKDVNRLISNIYWGQLSNYVGIPTDCPQRNERLGWSADTQVFCEAGSFNADTRSFFRKFLRDLRDSRCADGGYPSVAPPGPYGSETFSLGWADAGVIVPWTVWRQFGDKSILLENWEAMAKFVRRLDETKYDFEGKLDYIYADWLSYETFETCGNAFGSWAKWGKDPDAMNYRRYLAACYWLYDARMMVDMAEALGKRSEAAWFQASADRALAYIRAKFLEKDGHLLKPMRHLQTANVFALKHGIVEGAAAEAAKGSLLKSISGHGDCLQTGFLGTSFIMDALTVCGSVDVAYTLLLQHKCPSWLYSVDQGATTVWERWNSYTKKDGFGPVGMNSFNHYAYGAVLGWMYRVAAGISADVNAPGFKNIIMAPNPDRRLGWVKAEYKSAAGMVKSNWRYEGKKWVWEFAIPEGAKATVTVPGETQSSTYVSGLYRIEKNL